MARYIPTCEVANSSDISLYTSASGSDLVQCSAGTLQVVEYQPTTDELTIAQTFELFGATLGLWALAYVIRKAVDTAMNRR